MSSRVRVRRTLSRTRIWPSSAWATSSSTPSSSASRPPTVSRLGREREGFRLGRGDARRLRRSSSWPSSHARRAAFSQRRDAARPAPAAPPRRPPPLRPSPRPALPRRLSPARLHYPALIYPSINFFLILVHNTKNATGKNCDLVDQHVVDGADRPSKWEL